MAINHSKILVLEDGLYIDPRCPDAASATQLAVSASKASPLLPVPAPGTVGPCFVGALLLICNVFAELTGLPAWP